MPDASVGFQITSDPDTTSVASSSRPAGASLRERGGAFRLQLVADLDPQASVEDWSDGERVWDVDATSFADRMRAHGPRLEVAVLDRIGDGETRTLTWTADALDAFTPAGIAARVPELAALAAARDALASATTLDDLRARLRETGLEAADAIADAVRARPASSSPAPTTDDGSLDALLGLVRLDGEPDRPIADSPSGPLGAIIDAAQEPAGDLDRAAAARHADRLGERLRGQIQEILAHDDVRRAEAAWRGLHLLVTRLAFRKGAALSVLASSKADVAAAVHYQVLLPEFAHGSDRVPLAAILVDHAVETTSADLSILGDLAASGASLQVPVVASVSPAFFGLETPTDFSRLPPAVAHLQKPEYAAFRSLRTRPEAGQLVLAVPPFLLRHAYGAGETDAAFGVASGDRVWGGGALLVGLAMAEAHRGRGWPTASAGQAVPDLPVRETRMGAMPLAASFRDAVLDDLARAGLVGFSGPLRTDRAVLGPPATTATPAAASDDARARATLPASVFSALAAHRALTIGPACAGLGVDAAIAEIDRRFRAFLRGDGGPVDENAVTVQHLDEHETGASRTYGVRLRPPRAVLPQPVGVVFGVEVPNAGAADAA